LKVKVDMTSLSAIQKSRRGYAYQYKFALWKILNHLLKGEIKSAHVDFPFGKEGHSLDLRVVLLKSGGVHIYEVKTGEYFVSDKNEEIGQVLRTSIEFALEIPSGTDYTVNIIITPDVKPEIIENWRDLITIKTRGKNYKNKNGETHSQITKRCYRQYQIERAKLTVKKFIEFIRFVNLDIGYGYDLQHELDSNTDIEDIIESQILDLCKYFKVGSAETEIPSRTIVLELLDVLYQCSEKGSDIVPLLAKVLADALARKLLIVQKAQYPDGRSKEILLQEEFDVVAKKLSSITKVAIPVSETAISKADI